MSSSSSSVVAGGGGGGGGGGTTSASGTSAGEDEDDNERDGGGGQASTAVVRTSTRDAMPSSFPRMAKFVETVSPPDFGGILSDGRMYEEEVPRAKVREKQKTKTIFDK